MSHVLYKGVTEGKIETEGKMSFSTFIFIYTIYLAYLKVYTKFKNTNLGQKFSLKRKKNEQIKGLISNMWLFFRVFLLHNTTHHYQALYQISQGKNEKLKKKTVK